MQQEPEHSQWTGKTKGLPLMHRMLIGSCRFMPLWFIYMGLAIFVVPSCMIFSHKGYIAIYHYFRERWHYSPLKSLWWVYKNHYRFGQVIIDRFYAYAGGSFNIDIDNYDLYLELEKKPEGFMMVSSHIGSYELAGYKLKAQNKRFNALVYGGEAQVVMQNRQTKLTRNNIRMIPYSNDMTHLFLLSSALGDGEVVSIPGDRLFGSPRSVECQFFGSSARFPQGPFSLASQRNAPMLAVNVMREGYKKYRIHITQLPQPHANASRKESVEMLAQAFASELERVLTLYPEQWFNYFEFWNQ